MTQKDSEDDTQPGAGPETGDARNPSASDAPPKIAHNGEDDRRPAPQSPAEPELVAVPDAVDLPPAAETSPLPDDVNADDPGMVRPGLIDEPQLSTPQQAPDTEAAADPVLPESRPVETVIYDAARAPDAMLNNPAAEFQYTASSPAFVELPAEAPDDPAPLEPFEPAVDRTFAYDADRAPGTALQQRAPEDAGPAELAAEPLPEPEVPTATPVTTTQIEIEESPPEPERDGLQHDALVEPLTSQPAPAATLAPAHTTPEPPSLQPAPPAEDTGIPAAERSNEPEPPEPVPPPRPPPLRITPRETAPSRWPAQAREEPAWQSAPAHPAFQDAPQRFDARRHVPRTSPVEPSSSWDRIKDKGRNALRYAAYAVGGYFAFVVLLIFVYRFVNPPASSLMLVQALTGTDVRQEWVPLDEISPALVRAVIVSEDWTFCEHYGIDIKAIEQAIERSGNGIPRGASTISMQTTKNLFLWNAKSYIRKAVELPLTLAIELVWPKSRILEIYLNVAEWGPGIFGAEAAAQYHFNKPASRLGEREAAQLAASLPNPIIREAGDPGPRTARKATVIQSRMRNAGDAAQCVLSGRR